MRLRRRRFSMSSCRRATAACTAPSPIAARAATPPQSARWGPSWERWYLERVPLKYEGLSYTEIWISESQERMVLSVPRDKWPELQALCASEDVEAAALGVFE